MTASTCVCPGCVSTGRCDDLECGYGCGRRATTQWGTCRVCEDEVTGRDGDEDDLDDDN